MPIQNSDLFSCPQCAENIKADATQCRFCNVDLFFEVLILKPCKSIHRNQLLEDLNQLRNVHSLSSEEVKKRLRLNQVFVSGIPYSKANELKHVFEKYDGSIDLVFIKPSSFKKTVQSFLSTSSILIPTSIAITAVLLGTFKFIKPELEKLLQNRSNPVSSEKQSDVSTLPPPSSAKLETQNESINFDQLISASVTLESENSVGSGFFVHPSGFVLTNYHVVQDKKQLSIKLSNGQRTRAVVLDARPEFDLALVRAEGAGFPYMKLGDTATLKAGQNVWSIGAPSGLDFTVNKGIVSFVGRSMNGRMMVQIDTPINQGNSGGPLINSAGEVVGVNTATLEGKDGLHFSVPINFAYMGDQAILRPIFGYLADNGLTAQWRQKNHPTDLATYHKGNIEPQSPSLQKPANSQTTNTVSDFSQRAQAYQDFISTMNREMDLRKTNIESINAQLESIKKKYNAVNGNISDDQKLGQQVQQLTKNLTREQMAYAQKGIEMNKSKTLMLQEMIDSAPNTNVKSQALKALSDINNDNQYFSNLFTQANKQLKDAEATVY